MLFELGVGDQRSDSDFSFGLIDGSKTFHAFQVDQVAGSGEAELHQEDQLRTATEERGFESVGLRKLAGLGDRSGAVELERWEFHESTSPGQNLLTRTAPFAPAQARRPDGQPG